MRTWCMIDIESLGTKNNCPVLSLGAVSYDYESSITAEFHEFFMVDEQFKLGRAPQWSTIQWWLKQEEDARMRMSENRADALSIEEMTDAFYEWWIDEVGSAPQTWAKDFDRKSGPHVMSNGASFDISIVSNLLEEVPWHYHNERCYRSMVDWFPAPTMPNRQTTRHDALADATYQAQVHLNLMASYENLR
jgi:exodeoxyribonuclease VIII